MEQMLTEHRNSAPPIPDNYQQILTDQQLMTLQKVESFGGELWFIRRPLFQDVVPVVKFCDSKSNCTAVIEEDGFLNKQHNLVIRH